MTLGGGQYCPQSDERLSDKSHGPCPGNRNVEIEALSALAGKGEAAEAWETSGEQVSKTESCFLSLTHLSSFSRSSRKRLEPLPPSFGNCRSMARVGNGVGSPSQMGHCSYNISLRQIS